MEKLIEALPTVMLLAVAIALLGPLLFCLALLLAGAGGGTSRSLELPPEMRARLADLPARIRYHRHELGLRSRAAEPMTPPADVIPMPSRRLAEGARRAA